MARPTVKSFCPVRGYAGRYSLAGGLGPRIGSDRAKDIRLKPVLRTDWTNTLKVFTPSVTAWAVGLVLLATILFSDGWGVRAGGLPRVGRLCWECGDTRSLHLIYNARVRGS
ncbi:hypothetical protein K227x_28980 [Rubripirellula lacrimiformis]|uniref:Uncharacterized protein n=1 Tax=Rubripirellula lacrimiformis TaxID=1930273 RepID=A0A517NBI9_9BACT|nr:hypothetical protein K227x_28980 [Rubripirellula lacrimiformis]